MLLYAIAFIRIMRTENQQLTNSKFSFSLF